MFTKYCSPASRRRCLRAAVSPNFTLFNGNTHHFSFPCSVTCLKWVPAISAGLTFEVASSAEHRLLACRMPNAENHFSTCDRRAICNQFSTYVFCRQHCMGLVIVPGNSVAPQQRRSRSDGSGIISHTTGSHQKLVEMDFRRR